LRLENTVLIAGILMAATFLAMTIAALAR